MGIIISCFIGCGRRYFKNTYGNKAKVFDAIERLENDDLEGFYNAVMDNVAKHDIVFIDASKETRGIFNEKGTDYDVFYPSKERRKEFIENMVRKRTKPSVIQEVDRYFEEWVDEIDRDESDTCYKHKLSEKGEFLGNSNVIMQYVNGLNNEQG